MITCTQLNACKIVRTTARHYVRRLNTGNRGWVTLAGWSSQLADKAIPSAEQRFQQETRTFRAKGLSREKRYNVMSPSSFFSPFRPAFRDFAARRAFLREKLSLRGRRERLLSSPFSPYPLWSSFAPVIVFATRFSAACHRVDPRKGFPLPGISLSTLFNSNSRV